MNIIGATTKRGFFIKTEEKYETKEIAPNQFEELWHTYPKLFIDYPESIWESYPDELKQILKDNVVFLLTMDLPVITNKKKISYTTNYPIFSPILQRCFLGDVPDTATNAEKSVHESIKRFLNIDYSFANYDINLPKYSTQMEEKALIPMSFGKDSLLSYALSKEIGLNPELVTVRETGLKKENIERDKLIRKFTKEFDNDVWQLRNEFAGIHPNLQQEEDESKWWVFGLSLVEYALELLPFAHKLKTKYIVFGNETSCNVHYYTKEGYKAHPVVDQTHKFMKFYDGMTRMMTGDQVQCISMIEPLNDLAIIRILHKRYPEIGKYQMSCFPDDHGNGKVRWCHNCSKCARLFVYLKANNVNVKKVGFTQNLFNKEAKDLYSIFANKKKNMMGYDDSEANTDEMKFAFYLAYKQKHKGYLINLFKKKYLEEMKEKEDEMYSKYFGIYKSITMPSRIKKKIFKIYKEELEYI